MASISANGSKGHHKFTLNVTEDYIDKDSNVSYVGFTFVLSSLGGGWDWEGWGSNVSYVVTVAGERFTGTIPNYDGYSNVTLKSSSLEIIHDDDGSKTISFSFTVTDTTGQNYTSGNASASGSMALTNIPQYLSINSVEVTNKTENSVVVKWSVSDPRSSTYYSLDNGSTWIGSATNGETLASDNRSGTFNIPNLVANTTYNLKVKFRRADTDLWTESGNQSFTTYDYPNCTNSPDFTIGDTLTLSFYNPLNRSITVTIKGNDGSTIDVFNNLTGTSLAGYNAQDTVNKLYNSIPNSQSGKYKVIVTYGNVERTRDTGNSYRIRGNEIPTINAFDYFDNNSSVVNITQNNKHIVQNKSDLWAIFHAATTNFGAGSIARYVFECNGISKTESQPGSYQVGTIDSAQNVDLTLTVFDSRGLSASQKIKVTMLAHSKPTANVSLQRLNNYEETTFLTVDGSVSSVNGKNTMTIQYQYKESGGSFNTLRTITDNVQHTVPEDLDNNKVYVFRIVVSDSFGEPYDKEHILGKGVFPLFIDIDKNSVGVNKFPVYDKSFETLGLFSLGERQSFHLEAGESVEITIFLALCSGLVNFRISGANLEVARLFYVFRSNQYFGVHKTLFDESYGNTSAVVPMETRNAEQGYIFKITNNHSSGIDIRYGILELC